MTRAEQTAEQLRTVISALVRRTRAASAEQPYTWPQGAVLRRLDSDGPMTTADLARAELIKPQTMGTMVAELEEAGLVTRTDDAEDGRRRVVSLTKATPRNHAWRAGRAGGRRSRRMISRSPAPTPRIRLWRIIVSAQPVA